MMFKNFLKHLPWMTVLVLLAWVFLEYFYETGDVFIITVIFLALLVNIASAAIAFEYNQFLEEKKERIFKEGDDDFRA